MKRIFVDKKTTGICFYVMPRAANGLKGAATLTLQSAHIFPCYPEALRLGPSGRSWRIMNLSVPGDAELEKILGIHSKTDYKGR